MKMNATDLGAKLLATENITVVRNRTRTASFDIKSRVLTLPQWKEMTPEIEGMLVGHEVGHALYTDEEYLKPIDANRSMMQYLNVIEDVRIEKLIKRKYPGLRKTMNEGYKQLNDRDFFGVSKIPSMDALILIDKINLYFKAGFNCGVKFTSEEKPFVIRAETTETVDDVITLADEIYTFSKAQAKNRKEKMSLEHPEDLLEEDAGEYDLISDSDDDEFDSIDSEGMDYSEDSDDDGGFYDRKEIRGAGGRDEEEKKEAEEIELEKELESKTEEIFSQKLEELADESTVYKYYTLDEKYAFDPIVAYKTVISETSSVDESLTEQDLKELAKFKLDSSRVVNYLIKEFEMRKSAAMYKRAQTSKIGSLDMKKIWSYKLNDDLFKRVISLPEGKNHGMIFLLDWSGSMDHVLKETVQQVINLAMFCQRAQIPYQVFAFSNHYRCDTTVHSKLNELRNENYNQTTVVANACTSFSLLELFSHKMSNVEFNTMVRRLINTYEFMNSKDGEYKTGGTPLNEALAYLVNYIPRFTKTNNIEKLSLITLTDGEGSALHAGHSYFEESGYDVNSKDYKRFKQKHFVQDPLTKKSYAFSRDSTIQTESLLRLIKDRYNVNIVGFYITPNTRRELDSAIKRNLSGFQGSSYAMIDLMRKDFKDKGFSSIKNTGRDDLFIIPVNKLRMEEGEMEVSEKDNARAIARNFGKLLNGKKTSRVLLNQFIGYVA